MNSSVAQTSVPLVPILPEALRKWAAPIEPALQRLIIPDRVARALQSAPGQGRAAEFSRTLLQALDIRFAVDSADLERLPAKGSFVAVANHPFGIVEGLVLTMLLDRARPDAKLVANSILAAVPPMRDALILVNPFQTQSATRENLAPLRRSLARLKSGGALVIFPGGEVASLNLKEHSVTDPPWKSTAARLAMHARCPVVPIFFPGANSVPFHVACALHPFLRTLSLAREFEKRAGTTVHLRIGNPIPAATLSAYPDARSATAYLRSRVYFLANRSEPMPFAATSPLTTARTVTPAGQQRLLSEEVAALPPACQLCANSEFAVYLAKSTEIPHVLAEIGRCREIAFRETGEGTGEQTDLDRFDRYYQHLFLWSRTDLRLAGAYRLAITSDVLPRHGIGGLYTSTLFRFRPHFFTRIGPAVELGRSFVVPEYQKNYASLLLLWKGITRAVQRRPEAPVLFGAVSISNQYQAASRSLMVNYLTARASHELARFVQPRKRFRHKVMSDAGIKRFASLAADIEDISLSVADIEHDSKGVPVLLRQYLKAGGRLLGFNLDPSFSDVLDGLIVADLRTVPQALLERCMGRDEAKAFLALHGTR